MASDPSLWSALLGVGIALPVVGLAIYFERRQRHAPKPVVPGPGGRVALRGVPSLECLRETPGSVNALRGAVARVYTMNLPVFTSGEAGNSTVRRTGLYIVDTAGAIHEVHGILSPTEVESLGSALAETLGVPYDHR